MPFIETKKIGSRTNLRRNLGLIFFKMLIDEVYEIHKSKFQAGKLNPEIEFQRTLLYFTVLKCQSVFLWHLMKLRHPS